MDNPVHIKRLPSSIVSCVLTQTNLWINNWTINAKEEIAAKMQWFWLEFRRRLCSQCRLTLSISIRAGYQVTSKPNKRPGKCLIFILVFSLLGNHRLSNNVRYMYHLSCEILFIFYFLGVGVGKLYSPRRWT